MRAATFLKLFTTLAIAVAFFTTAAYAAGTVYVKKAENAKFGTILTGANGMTLYTFAKDEPGVSACYGDCAEKWPPLTVSDMYSFDNMDGKLGLTKRNDGSYQVTYMGKPLYFWFKDQKAGDTTGHMVKNVWFVAQ